MSGGEEGETRLHWLRPQHQLVALAGFAWEETTLLPAFLEPQQNGTQSRKKPGDPGASHCCWELYWEKKLGKNSHPWEFLNQSLGSWVGSAGALGHSGSLTNVQNSDSLSSEIHRRHFQLDVSGYSNSWLASIGFKPIDANSFDIWYHQLDVSWLVKLWVVLIKLK